VLHSHSILRVSCDGSPLTGLVDDINSPLLKPTRGPVGASSLTAPPQRLFLKSSSEPVALFTMRVRNAAAPDSVRRQAGKNASAAVAVEVESVAPTAPSAEDSSAGSAENTCELTLEVFQSDLAEAENVWRNRAFHPAADAVCVCMRACCFMHTLVCMCVCMRAYLCL